MRELNDDELKAVVGGFSQENHSLDDLPDTVVVPGYRIRRNRNLTGYTIYCNGDCVSGINHHQTVCDLLASDAEVFSEQAAEATAGAAAIGAIAGTGALAISATGVGAPVGGSIGAVGGVGVGIGLAAAWWMTDQANDRREIRRQLSCS